MYKEKAEKARCKYDATLNAELGTWLIYWFKISCVYRKGGYAIKGKFDTF